MKDRIKVHVLIIEHDQSLCQRLQDWLESESYEVAAFADPRRGLEHASRCPCQIALVDLRLPQTDGVKLVEALVRTAPAARVLAMSAFPDADLVVRAVQAGARDLLHKPIERAVLLQTLQQQLAEMGISVRTERDFNRRLGARVREIRLANQMPQNEVARQADITPAQLSQIELGKTATSTWTLARICGALKLPMRSLFDGL